MRRIIRFALLLMWMCGVDAAAAGTGGYNLGWDECGVAGAVNKDFACDTNAETRDIVVSFMLSVEAPRFVGTTVILQAEVAATEELPDWWAFNSCRPGALSATGDFMGMSACTDPYGGGAIDSPVGVIERHPNQNGLRFGVSTTLIGENHLVAGIEYYAVRFTVTNAATSGSGTCEGCSTQVSIHATEVRVGQPTGVGDIVITTPLTQGTITWQGGVVPVRNRTWGQIKGMYR